MNRLALIAATCFLGLTLTACDKGTKPETATQNPAEQTEVKDTGAKVETEAKDKAADESKSEVKDEVKDETKGMDTTQPAESTEPKTE